jgi:hypothetical protein
MEKKYHTVRIVPTFNRNIVDIGKFDIPNTHINGWHVSTSFKIHLEILLNSYITFSFFPVLVKGLYQTDSYSLHVMQLVAFKPQKNISGFHTLGCWVAMAYI